MTDQIYPTTNRPSTIDNLDSWEKHDESIASAPALPGDWRLADHKNNGRVIVTTPNNDGRVYYVLPSDLDGLGFDWLFCHADELTYLDGDQ